MPEQSFEYDFQKGYGGSDWQKYWVWLTQKGFTDDPNEEPIPLELSDGDKFHIEVDPKPNFPAVIEAFIVRLHNVSCPNLKKKGTAIGYLESYIWEKNSRGDLTRPVRFVPTTKNMGERLPPYWVALPDEKSSSWGTFVIVVIDHGEVTKLLLNTKSRLTFSWRGNPISVRERAKLKAKSLELHIICK